MSCNHCCTKFNFFHKEMGCANCGISFCSKCLKQKSKVPSKGKGEHSVCRSCFAKLSSGPNAQQQQIPPPETFIKRLENLENPPTSSLSTSNNGKSQIAAGPISAIDQKIVERLKKLKDDGKGPPPSENEIRERLANLRGQNHYMEGPSRQHFLPDTKTDSQKVDALLEQFTNEREIELSHNPQEEIEVRLATLRDQGVRPNEGSYISNLQDSSDLEEGEVDSITRKIMDEVALDDRCPVNLSVKEEEEEEEPDRNSPELPWCVLCNNDARYRCLDCSGDLYCSQCNTEVHKTWGDTDHKVISYEPRKP